MLVHYLERQACSGLGLHVNTQGIGDQDPKICSLPFRILLGEGSNSEPREPALRGY